jgi:hypothetical protein
MLTFVNKIEKAMAEMFHPVPSALVSRDKIVKANMPRPRYVTRSLVG